MESAGALWLQDGPAIAPELLKALPKYLADDLYAPQALRVLALMGPHARPILPYLDRFLASRQRVDLTLGDLDADMRADDMLLAAMSATREQITR